MNLKSYFDTASGTGVLATSNAQGQVDAALYSRPHIFDDGTLAFIMRERLTHENLQSNPHAAYLFKEEGRGASKGVRLFLTKVKEEKESDLLYRLRRRKYTATDENDPKYLVFFKIDKELPLVGPGEED
jgi:hypothetical protein